MRVSLRPVTVAVIRIWLCFPRRVSAALPRALLLSCPIALALTLSSLGPGYEKRSVVESKCHMVVMARYLLLLFMVFQNVFNLLSERFEAKSLVMR